MAVYSQSLLIITMAGKVVRLFTPFQVIDIETKQRFWVSKIVWDEIGKPFYQINDILVCYNSFIVV